MVLYSAELYRIFLESGGESAFQQLGVDTGQETREGRGFVLSRRKRHSVQSRTSSYRDYVRSLEVRRCRQRFEAGRSYVHGESSRGSAVKACKR